MRTLSTFLTLIILCIGSNCYAKLEDGFKATCKVHRIGRKDKPGGIGTGTVFAENDKSYFILTAGHIAKKLDDTIYLKFYHSGFESHIMYCKVRYTVFDITSIEDDWAILEVLKSVYNKKPYPKPSIIPLSEERPKKKEVVFSVGYPHANWPTGWIGHIRHVAVNFNGEVTWLKCIPGAIPGRSGSAIMDRKCTKIYGVIVKLTGLCTSTEFIKRSKNINKLIGIK